MTIKNYGNTKVKSVTEKILEQIYTNRDFRKELADNDMFWFFGIYFSHYIKHKTAEFQKEIINLASDENIRILAITAFRNSGKSTLCSLVLPIWGVVGKWRKKYVLIVCQNQDKTKETMINIRTELDDNGMLAEDYQPREGRTDKWSEDTIIIPKYGAKISAISINESVRSLRHLQYRPDLIICDDLEDVPSCQNYENRKKLWQFVNGELIPVGDLNTKYIFIGNKVHSDSLMMKLKDAIESGKMDGIYKEYPLIDKNRKILWPGKFSDMKAINKLKGTYASEIDYLREQMLLILPEGDAIIKPEDIHYYKDLPITKPDYFIVSIDPAFTEGNNSDNTAIVGMAVYKENGKVKIYINPRIVNKKLSTEQLIEETKRMMLLSGDNTPMKIYVEEVSAQKTLVDMLQYANIPAEGIGIGGKDKSMRLNAISPWIKNGQIVFPATGDPVLVNQILYFGTERFDDLVDALTLAVNKVIKDENQPKDTVIMVNMDEPLRDSVINYSQKSSLNNYDRFSDWGDKEDKEIFKNYGLRKALLHELSSKT